MCILEGFTMKKHYYLKLAISACCWGGSCSAGTNATCLAENNRSEKKKSFFHFVCFLNGQKVPFWGTLKKESCTASLSIPQNTELQWKGWGNECCAWHWRIALYNPRRMRGERSIKLKQKSKMWERAEEQVEILSIKLQRILLLTIKFTICWVWSWFTAGERAQSSIKNKTEIPKGYLSNCFASAFFLEWKKMLPNKRIVSADVMIFWKVSHKV